MAFSAGEDYKDVIEALPKKRQFRLYCGFWFLERVLPSIMHFIKNFNPRPADIYLMTYPKCGTTWIKALAFSILNRRSFSSENHPLLTTHPQKLVPFLQSNPPPSVREWEDLPSPRLLASHVHYSLLPDKMKNDDFGCCRMIYVARDPKDAFISTHFFINEARQGSPNIPFNESFTDFCHGYGVFGSIWDHQMEYKRESLKRPDKILFLNYEEMKESSEEHVRRIAEFLGQPFSEEEERGGAVGEIAKLCSFDFLKELEVNKQGTVHRHGEMVFKTSIFFRKGKVGDWKEHLTPEMAERMDDITLQKKDEYGLI